MPDQNPTDHPGYRPDRTITLQVPWNQAEPLVTALRTNLANWPSTDVRNAIEQNLIAPLERAIRGEGATAGMGTGR